MGGKFSKRGSYNLQKKEEKRLKKNKKLSFEDRASSFISLSQAQVYEDEIKTPIPVHHENIYSNHYVPNEDFEVTPTKKISVVFDQNNSERDDYSSPDDEKIYDNILEDQESESTAFGSPMSSNFEEQFNPVPRKTWNKSENLNDKQYEEVIEEEREENWKEVLNGTFWTDEDQYAQIELKRKIREQNEGGINNEEQLKVVENNKDTVKHVEEMKQNEFGENEEKVPVVEIKNNMVISFLNQDRKNEEEEEELIYGNTEHAEMVETAKYQNLETNRYKKEKEEQEIQPETVIIPHDKEEKHYHIKEDHITNKNEEQILIIDHKEDSFPNQTNYEENKEEQFNKNEATQIEVQYESILLPSRYNEDTIKSSNKKVSFQTDEEEISKEIVEEEKSEEQTFQKHKPLMKSPSINSDIYYEVEDQTIEESESEEQESFYDAEDFEDLQNEASNEAQVEVVKVNTKAGEDKKEVNNEDQLGEFEKMGKEEEKLQFEDKQTEKEEIRIKENNLKIEETEEEGLEYDFIRNINEKQVEEYNFDYLMDQNISKHISEETFQENHISISNSRDEDDNLGILVEEDFEIFKKVEKTPKLDQTLNNHTYNNKLKNEDTLLIDLSDGIINTAKNEDLKQENEENTSQVEIFDDYSLTFTDQKEEFSSIKPIEAKEDFVNKIKEKNSDATPENETFRRIDDNIIQTDFIATKTIKSEQPIDESFPDDNQQILLKENHSLTKSTNLIENKLLNKEEIVSNIESSEECLQKSSDQLEDTLRHEEEINEKILGTTNSEEHLQRSSTEDNMKHREEMKEKLLEDKEVLEEIKLCRKSSNNQSAIIEDLQGSSIKNEPEERTEKFVNVLLSEENAPIIKSSDYLLTNSSNEPEYQNIFSPKPTDLPQPLNESKLNVSSPITTPEETAKNQMRLWEQHDDEEVKEIISQIEVIITSINKVRSQIDNNLSSTGTDKETQGEMYQTLIKIMREVNNINNHNFNERVIDLQHKALNEVHECLKKLKTIN